MTQEKAARLRELLSIITLPVTVRGLPFDGFEDPVIVDAEGRYVAQASYDTLSHTTTDVDERAELIAAAINALPEALAKYDPQA